MIFDTKLHNVVGDNSFHNSTWDTSDLSGSDLSLFFLKTGIIKELFHKEGIMVESRENFQLQG